jgi:hypothetical protein
MYSYLIPKNEGYSKHGWLYSCVMTSIHCDLMMKYIGGSEDFGSPFDVNL